MKKIITIVVIFMISILVLGCGSDDLRRQNSDLQKQVSDLKKENTDLKNQVSMYAPKDKTTGTTDSTSASNQPVAPSSIKIGPDEVGITEVNVSFKNVSQKNVDAIEFVVLKFDNFGKPSDRDNVTSVLTMQGNAAPSGNLSAGWTLFADSKKARKAKVVVKQVHFTDGTVWGNNSFENDVAKGKASYE